MGLKLLDSHSIQNQLFNHVQTFSDEILCENDLELHRQHVLKFSTGRNMDYASRLLFERAII